MIKDRKIDIDIEIENFKLNSGRENLREKRAVNYRCYNWRTTTRIPAESERKPTLNYSFKI